VGKPSEGDLERKCITNYSSLKEWMSKKGFTADPCISDVIDRYPMKINSYYLGLIKEKGDPIWRQAIPDVKELNEYANLEADPLYEEKQRLKKIKGNGDSNYMNVVMRYPDRALLQVSNVCAMYCRFCTRKRKVGDSNKNPTIKDIDEGIEGIANYNLEVAALHNIGEKTEKTFIRDIIISGGDPLMLSNSKLEHILEAIRKIPYLEMVRIGTRVPVTFPQRILEDGELVNILRKYRKNPPLYINTHFNTPIEITNDSSEACDILADTGIPLGNQTVLMKGVNDNPHSMKKLMQGLLSIRVRPYYIYFPDLVQGTGHFRVPVQKGLEIMERLRGYTSGLAVPYLMIDGPGGKGKTPIVPNYVISLSKAGVVMKNYAGEEFIYPNPRDR